MSATCKTAITASLAAAIMAAVESLQNGHKDVQTVLLHAGMAAALVAAAYLKQSPLKPRTKGGIKGGS